MLKDGAIFEEIIKEYPKLTEEDIRATLEYSIHLINQPENEIIPIVDQEMRE